MNSALSQVAFMILLGPIALGQTVEQASDCSTLKHSRHKVSCLCGAVDICAGDICGSPSVYELDDNITVELRAKNGTVLESQKAAFEVNERQGTTQDGTAISFEQKERSFYFKDKPDGDYLLAFILHKNGVAQPAAIFPTNYSHKRKSLSPTFYMVEPICPKWDGTQWP